MSFSVLEVKDNQQSPVQLIEVGKGWRQKNADLQR